MTQHAATIILREIEVDDLTRGQIVSLYESVMNNNTFMIDGAECPALLSVMAKKDRDS